jgi:prevent-host-death family protein
MRSLPVREVGSYEAKTHLPELLKAVEMGEEITITRRGRAVAKLVPVVEKRDPEAAIAVIRRIRERAKNRGVGKFDWAEWKRCVEEGRP